MMRFNHIFRAISCLLFITVGGHSYGQMDKLIRCQTLLNTKIPANIDMAIPGIDSVIKHPETKADYKSWTTRAFLYYEVYKRNDKYRLNSRLRDTVLSSVHISNNLKPDSAYLKYNRTFQKNIASGYYNLCKSILQDSMNFERSLIAFERYKVLYREYDPSFDFKSVEITYYLAVSTVYNEKFAKDSSQKTIEVSEKAYQKVLDISPDNRDANLGMGLLHYNEAVALGMKLEFGDDLEQIEAIQDNMVKLAKESEGYVLRVYNLNKKDPKSIEALYYIYRMLMDKPKHEDFKKKCTELGIIVNEEKSSGG